MEEPETIFLIFLNVCSLSPGLTLSGEYPIPKSLFKIKPDSFSSIGLHSSYVQPGYTVDSKTTISPFFRIPPTIFVAFNNGPKSGCFELFIGVGTATI